MSNLIIQSKIFSLGGEMWITDENENPRYTVKGSFLKFPKEFVIYDENGQARARVIHKMVSLLPKFLLEIDGNEVATISKRFSFLKPKYDIDAVGVSVEGNIWDMNFEIVKNGATIGRIDKSWVSFRDKYALEILDEADELIVLGLVLAIDYVKNEDQSVANSIN
ncbi:LURP-one-related/scramblase family protein [Lactococcus nasutitermitis]|uniref:LURP-one-related/scramblase family protein n=1 Tax=Lactococcus nasutitermitis TaxID=1652957 RepID=A0ABV9JFL7_9LACT|nr:LURP-one-related family protein [Lactococcus nasutitermitis]